MCNSGGASHFDVNTKKQVEFKKFNLLGGSGGRICTNDLRVMSPTSYQTAPPRDIYFSLLSGSR